MTAVDSSVASAVASEIAVSVGPQLRQALNERPRVEHKESFHDPVTELDRRVECEIREGLTCSYPNSVICGEEGGTEGFRGDGIVEWYVDPIDGTANFARGVPFFCVSIGCVVDGEAIAGVVYDPVREEVFSASEHGAWLNGVPLRSSGARTDSEALIDAGYPSYRDMSGNNSRVAVEHFTRLQNAFGTCRCFGASALTLSYIAAGRIDVGLGLHIHPWDVTAGLLLVRQAGGVYRPIPLGYRGFVGGAQGYLAAVGTFNVDASEAGSVAKEMV